ncbi:MAG TPA: S41 family peptidase [Anaerolineales bacterium]|nr:S41 family peptidase [Anaerolineales bacterium]
MKRKKAFLAAALLVFSLALSACAGFLPMGEDVEAGEYGPAYSPQEHQSRTFDALWEHIQDAYIYFETADVDWDAVHESYTQKIDSGLSNEEFVSLLDDLEAELPSGSFVHQSRAERVETDLSDLATYDGIGAFIGFQEEEVPHIVILDVIEGSPAEEAGLQAHDSIFGIDGNPISVEEGLRAVERIRGPAGTTVTLDVQSPGGPQRQLDVERAKLTSTGKLDAYTVPGTNYGYLLFPPIGYEGLEQDVLNSLQTLSADQELEGLILDLRIANSSRGWPLETLFTMFHDGAIGELYNRSQAQALQVQGQDVFGSQNVPLVILVGENTAGFPELFSASLQMHDRAAVIGGPTHGEVETQSSFYLPDGSRIFVESASFRLPNGDDVGESGVAPDLQVEAGWDEVLPGNDPVLERAVLFLDEEQ